MTNTKLICLVLLAIIGENFANFPYLIENTLREYRRKYMKTDESHYPQKPLREEYDFIVVGSGPSGAVVANRLSENPNWQVLLLEAGREDSIITDVPIFVSYMTFTDFNWGFKAEPQPGACLGLNGQQCLWPRGKGLGGTSLINYMIYTRGNKADYDLWASQGNPGWAYADVLPYFLKSEDSRIPEFENSPLHHKKGPLPVEHMKFQTKLAEAFLEAGQEIGYPIIDYNNGEIPSGFAKVQEMVDRGHRASSSKSFLRPVKNRSNLHISLKSRVTKVLINPMTKTAEGIEVVRNRHTYVVRARKEVILSAGSLSSPQLLMLSGVGPKDHLDELGIPVIQDLPGVGQNLNEHLSYCGLTFVTNHTYTGLVENRLFDVKYFQEFFENGTGPLTIGGGVEGLGYISTKLNDDPYGRPDIELIFAGASIVSDAGRTFRQGIGVRDDIYEETYRPVDYRDSWTVLPMILHPKSRGYMRLKSKNPWNWPKFYANYFQNEQDLDTIVEGIKFTIELSKTKAFQKYGSTLHDIPIKPCVSDNSPQGSDNYWRCAVRHLTMTLHHQSGTCKMGPASDPDAVVDHQLRVYGINNLRVIDASIIPQLVTAHTTAPAFMIGEKGSDMIKAAWNDPASSNTGSQPSTYPGTSGSYPGYPGNNNQQQPGTSGTYPGYPGNNNQQQQGTSGTYPGNNNQEQPGTSGTYPGFPGSNNQHQPGTSGSYPGNNIQQKPATTQVLVPGGSIGAKPQPVPIPIPAPENNYINHLNQENYDLYGQPSSSYNSGK